MAAKACVWRWAPGIWCVQYHGRMRLFGDWRAALGAALADVMAEFIETLTPAEADALIHAAETPEGLRQAVIDAFTPCAICGCAVRSSTALWRDGEAECRDCYNFSF